MTFWRDLSARLGRAARIGLLTGAGVILLGTLALGYVLLRTEYQVLFGGLSPQDTATMAAELDRQKIPYEVREQENGEAALMVDKNQVHQTRLKLMGREFPIRGTVGFELFNEADFGMTEFAQKINYQRALQGELTRTILSLNEVREARVLLALPEQGLFKQATSRPKASVTLMMKQGQALRPEQVNGIQRLVAASVPGIAAKDVTLVDQSGVALTRPGGAEAEGDWAAGSGLPEMDLKKDIEKYLARKAQTVLDKALGPGVALASVDVALQMDRLQTTTEEVLGAAGKSDESTTGVLVRERQTIREPDSGAQAKAGVTGSGGSSQTETEYAVGRRVEQVVTQPGRIRQIQVAVVTHRDLSPEQSAKLSQTVAASVGASQERGDGVVIQSSEPHSLQPGAAPETPKPLGSWPAAPTAPEAHPIPGGFPETSSPASWPLLAGLAVLLLLGLAWIALAWRPRTQGEGGPAPLSDQERQAALHRVKAWMEGDRP